MAASEDRLLGKIAIQMGLITPGQLDQLVALSEQYKKPIGAILTEQGAIAPTDMQKLIDLRKLSVASDVAQPPRRHEQIVFARQLVRDGLLTEEFADECLREIAIEGDSRTIEELLVERGIVTKDKVAELKSFREKRPMHCPKCKINFNVKSASGRKTVECPKCKGPLTDPAPKAPAPSARSSVEFKTTVMKAIDPDPPFPPPERATGRRMRVQCIICDALFEGELEKGGRVKCPQCGSNFAPKEM